MFTDLLFGHQKLHNYSKPKKTLDHYELRIFTEIRVLQRHLLWTQDGMLGDSDGSVKVVTENGKIWSSVSEWEFVQVTLGKTSVTPRKSVCDAPITTVKRGKSIWYSHVAGANSSTTAILKVINFDKKKIGRERTNSLATWLCGLEDHSQWFNLIANATSGGS